MINKMTIKCYGDPTAVKTLVVKTINDGEKELKFNNVETKNENGLVTITYLASEPIPVKPWHITDFLTKIKGIEKYIDIHFNTNKFFVVFTQEMIDRFNQQITA